MVILGSDYIKKLELIEEENRLLKKKLKNYEDKIKQLETDITRKEFKGSKAKIIEEYQEFIANNVLLHSWVELRNPISLKQPIEDQVDEIFKEAYFKDINEGGMVLMGFQNREEFIGKPIVDFWAEETRKRGGRNHIRYVEILKERSQGGQQVVKKLVHGGEDIYYATSIQFIVENDCIVRFFSSQFDISTQKLAEKAAIESNKRYQYLFDYSNAGIYISKFDGKIVNANQALANILNYPVGELLKLNIMDFYINPAERHEILKILKERGQIKNFEVQFITKDEEIKWLSVTSKIMKIDNEHLILTIITDIDDKKRLERELMDSQELYQDLYDNAPDMYASIDAVTGNVAKCNYAVTNVLGFSEEEIINRNIFDLYHPSVLERSKELFKKFKETGLITNEELILKKKDGGKIDVSLNVTAIRDEEGTIIASRSVWRDISESKKIKRVLECYRQCLSAVLYAKDEASLMQEVCDILVNTSDYYMTWIGFAQNDKEKNILPLVHAGKEDEYLENIIIRWDNSEFGMGPTGMAIKTRQIQIVTNYETNTKFEPEKDLIISIV